MRCRRIETSTLLLLVSTGRWPLFSMIPFTAHACSRLDMLAPLYPVRDLRLSGQVIHVGRSSMEVAVRMETLDKDGTEETVMLGVCCNAYGASLCRLNSWSGRFCMVCRSIGTNSASPVNPLLITTPEDEALRNIGEGWFMMVVTRAHNALTFFRSSQEPPDEPYSEVPFSRPAILVGSGGPT